MLRLSLKICLLTYPDGELTNKNNAAKRIKAALLKPEMHHNTFFFVFLYRILLRLIANCSLDE